MGHDADPRVVRDDLRDGLRSATERYGLKPADVARVAGRIVAVIGDHEPTAAAWMDDVVLAHVRDERALAHFVDEGTAQHAPITAWALLTRLTERVDAMLGHRGERGT